MLAWRIGSKLNSLGPRPHLLAQAVARHNRCSPLLLHRTFALSRFENRGPGGSRTRSKVLPRTSNTSGSTGNQEETPSAEDSPLWETSTRLPVSNPDEGLERLLLSNELLVVTRQVEMLNIFIGFEQSNKYVITNVNEEVLGYIAEEPRGFFATFSRQIFRTHRPFRAIVMDVHGTPILWVRRPFAWINSRMFVQRLLDGDAYTPDSEPILDTFAEVQQRWHLWRRKYELYLRKKSLKILSTVSDPQPEPEIEPETFSQFSQIDEGLWAWHFTLTDARSQEIASVNRAFRGFGREIFTDTGQYFVRFGPQPEDPLNPVSNPPTSLGDLTLEQRALILAMAVNIDFDYFSRHSEGGHGLGFPFFWGGWGSGD